METLIQTLANEAISGSLAFDDSISRTIAERVKAIDKLLSEQLALIFHSPEFQRIEGAWRGLHYLVTSTPLAPDIKIRVLSASKREILEDLTSAPELDRSRLWKSVYEAECCLPGGQPCGAVIGDFEITNDPDDLALLEGISRICAASFAPFISAVSPRMFGFESWTELPKPMELSTIFESDHYARWNALRSSPESRFVALTLPRTLARVPYGANTCPIDEFPFEELPPGPHGESIPVDHDHFCWMNTAYVLGARLIDSFDKTGLCTAIRGMNGGRVEGLPAHVFATDEGDADFKCPTEVGITDRREWELSKLGFLPLVHLRNTEYAVFFSAETIHKPKWYSGQDAADANANARIAARLPYVMVSTRFAHYLMCFGHDQQYHSSELEAAQTDLQRWVAQYVNHFGTNPSQAERARFPLREANIVVKDVLGEPGSYNVHCFLRPWLPMEELTATLDMVVRIPKIG
jgi:type VI secretion system protein ImpC